MDMPMYRTPADIAIRLALTMFAGGIIGLNRGALARGGVQDDHPGVSRCVRCHDPGQYPAAVGR